MALLHHFGTSCIAGRNRITYGHEDGDVYQFENDRVVELSCFLFLCCRRLVFDIFFIRCAGMDGILGVYSSSSDNTSEYRIR